MFRASPYSDSFYTLWYHSSTKTSSVMNTGIPDGLRPMCTTHDGTALWQTQRFTSTNCELGTTETGIFPISAKEIGYWYKENFREQRNGKEKNIFRTWGGQIWRWPERALCPVLFCTWGGQMWGWPERVLALCLVCFLLQFSVGSGYQEDQDRSVWRAPVVYSALDLPSCLIIMLPIV